MNASAQPLGRLLRAIRPAIPARTPLLFAAMAIGFLEVVRYTQGPSGDLVKLEGWIAVGFALLWGALRVFRRHPLTQTGYLSWLAATPWRVGRPLPLGPVHLYWADVLVVGVIYAVAQRGNLPHPALPILAFTFGYTFVLTYLNAQTSAGWFAYVGLIALAGAVHQIANVPGALAMTTIALVVGLLGLGYALDRFPWDQTYRRLPWPKRFARAAVESGWIVWPMTHIGPTHLTDVRLDIASHDDDARLPLAVRRLRSVGYAVVIMLPIAVWVWAITSLYLEPGDADTSPYEWTYWVLVVISVVVLAVMLNTVNDYKSPLPFWTRVFTGHFVIPRYDVIAVGPIAGTAAAIGGPMAMTAAGVEPALAFAFGVMVTGMTYALFAVDKTIWTLTAPCRIEPTKPKKTKQVEGVLGRDVRELVRAAAERRG